MDDQSPRFALPLLAAGQAQKEVLHNEAVIAADTLLHPLAETIGDQAPPAAPTAGQSWIVGTAPTGAWAGHSGALATWTGGGWRFFTATEGMRVWVKAANLEARRGAAAWTMGVTPATRLEIGGVQVVGSRRPAIPSPSGGGTVDAEARASLASVIAALQSHGLIST